MNASCWLKVNVEMLVCGLGDDLLEASWGGEIDRGFENGEELAAQLYFMNDSIEESQKLVLRFGWYNGRLL